MCLPPTLTSIMNPGMLVTQTFIIRDIFRTLEYSKDQPFLIPCQTYWKVLGK